MLLSYAACRGVATGAVLLSLASSAAAESCAALQNRSTDLARELLLLAEQNPVSVSHAVTCLNDIAASGSVETVRAAFRECTTSRCVLTNDLQNCLTVTDRVFDILVEGPALKKRVDAGDCEK